MQSGFGPDDQLRSEASQQASQDSLQLPNQGTPRANRTSQNSANIPPTSSPLFFRSSPANGSANGVGANGLDISSPLGQHSAASSDGGQTPRASGQTLGGPSILVQ